MSINSAVLTRTEGRNGQSKVPDGYASLSLGDGHLSRSGLVALWKEIARAVSTAIESRKSRRERQKSERENERIVGGQQMGKWSEEYERWL